MLAPNFLATPAVVGSPIRISHHPSKTLGCHVSGSEEDLILENVEQIGWRSWDAQLTCPWRMGWGFDPLTVGVHRSAALPGHSCCTSASLLPRRKGISGPATSTIFWGIYLVFFSMHLRGSPIICFVAPPHELPMRCERAVRCCPWENPVHIRIKMVRGKRVESVWCPVQNKTNCSWTSFAWLLYQP